MGIFMNGTNTIVLHNTCEDSLLAAPLIIDLVILTELFCRIKYRDATEADASFEPFHPVLSVLSYLLKAPMVPEGTPTINAPSSSGAASPTCSARVPACRRTPTCCSRPRPGCQRRTRSTPFASIAN